MTLKPYPSMPAFAFEADLKQWFDEGHTRFVMSLQGHLAGSVLIAEPVAPTVEKAAAGAHLTIRSTITTSEGLITERLSYAMPSDTFDLDLVHTQQLKHEINHRLQGGTYPPAICFTTRPIGYGAAPHAPKMPTPAPFDINAFSGTKRKMG